MTATILNKNVDGVENKVRNTSNLVTTTVLNRNISKTENKIPDTFKSITTQKFNKLTAGNFAARLKQTDLVEKLILMIN